MLKSFLKFPEGTLKDSSGAQSGKRHWGSRLLLVGLALLVVHFLATYAAHLMFKASIPDNMHDNIMDAIRLCFITGGSLLGIGVFEQLKKK